MDNLSLQPSVCGWISQGAFSTETLKSRQSMTLISQNNATVSV